MHIPILCASSAVRASGHTGRRESRLSGMHSQNWGPWKHNTSEMHLSPPPPAELLAHWLTWCYQSLSHLVPLLVVITPCNGASCQRASNAAGPLSPWLSICRGSWKRSARTVAQRERQPETARYVACLAWDVLPTAAGARTHFLIVQMRTLAWVLCSNQINSRVFWVIGTVLLLLRSF